MAYQIAQPRPRRAPRGGATTAPRPRPAPTREGRPERRRRAILATFSAAFLSLLAVTGAHAYLAQQQVRLSRIDSQVAAAQRKQQELEATLYRLQQPAAIAQRASSELGLVQPTNVITVMEQGTTTTTQPSSSLQASVTGSSSMEKAQQPGSGGR